MYLSFAMGALADCSIAVTLCWLLHGARTGFGRQELVPLMSHEYSCISRTDTIVTTLISYMVTSGLFTA
jgi:hypothetical protein